MTQPDDLSDNSFVGEEVEASMSDSNEEELATVIHKRNLHPSAKPLKDM